MAQKKGQTGNPAGRPKGTPNKVTSDMKKWISKLLSKNRKQVETDLAALDPRDRIAALEKLMAYVVPKATTNMEISFEKLDEAQLNEIIDELSNNIKN